MDLYILLSGKSKKRLRPIMVDELHKVRNYRAAREAGTGKYRWHDIVPAQPDAVRWRKDSSSQWTGYDRPANVPSRV